MPSRDGRFCEIDDAQTLLRERWWLPAEYELRGIINRGSFGVVIEVASPAVEMLSRERVQLLSRAEESQHQRALVACGQITPPDAPRNHGSSPAASAAPSALARLVDAWTDVAVAEEDSARKRIRPYIYCLSGCTRIHFCTARCFPLRHLRPRRAERRWTAPRSSVGGPPRAAHKPIAPPRSKAAKCVGDRRGHCPNHRLWDGATNAANRAAAVRRSAVIRARRSRACCRRP